MANSRSAHFQEAHAITTATLSQFASSPSTYLNTALSTLDTRVTANTDVLTNKYTPYTGTAVVGSTVYVWATTTPARLLRNSTSTLAYYDPDTDTEGVAFTLTYSGNISELPGS